MTNASELSICSSRALPSSSREYSSPLSGPSATTHPLSQPNPVTVSYSGALRDELRRASHRYGPSRSSSNAKGFA